MPCLPQHDPRPTRAAELEERRARYVWDHDFLPPFPFLHIPDVQATGALNIVEVFAGSFSNLPAEEHPSDEWLIEKTGLAVPAIYELLGRVPAAEWIKLAATLNVHLRKKSEGWFEDALARLEALISERGAGASLPREAAVVEVITGLILEIAVELSVAVENDRSLPAKLVDLLSGLLGTRASEVDSISPREAAARAVEAGLSDTLIAAVVPVQTFLRFMATMETHGVLEPGAVLDRDALLPNLEDPKTPDPIADDAVFGRYPIAGPNPVVLRRVTAERGIPRAFAVGDGHLRVALDALGLDPDLAAAMSLERATAEGRLYLVDFALLEGMACRSGPDLDFFGQRLGEDTARQRYLPAAYGLFYRMADGPVTGLRAVAIQLGRDPAEHEVFTPADEQEVWRKAKMLYLCADFNHHEIATHLAGVHFVLEGFAVAAARQLHPDHPISALFAVHLQYLLWNNFLGRQTLTNPLGFVEQLLAGELDASTAALGRHYEGWDVSELDLPRELAARGVADPELLPEYPFRDDGMRHWDAIHAFVSDYLGLYYPTPEELAGDTELTAWLAELRAEDGAHVAGLGEIETVADLARLLTGIVFRAGPYHAAVNYGQYDMWGYPARVPAAAHADPRALRTTDYLDYLPSGEAALTQAGVMWVLASLRGETYGEVGLDHYRDPRVWPLVAALRVKMASLEDDIERANKTSRSAHPYRYLLPSLVPLASNV